MASRKRRFFYGTAYFGRYDVIVCPKGHTYWTSKASLRIEERAKELGLWGKPPPK